MKYHHPDVSSGKYDWNKEFLSQYESLEKVKTQTDLNKNLLNWISLFDFKDLEPNNEFDDDIQVFIKNIDFDWIKNSGFSDELIDKLILVKNNLSVDDYYASVSKLTSFISFENENGLGNFDEEINAHRLLFLASFWNAMKYWNVNLYLTDQDWSEVLEEMTQQFIMADTHDKFEIERLKLYSTLNDSHANVTSKYMYNDILKFHPPFGGRLVNDTLVITKIYNVELAEKDNIHLGNKITNIEGKKIESHLQDLRSLTSASNENYFKSWVEDQFILSNDQDSIQIQILNSRNEVKNKFIKLYPMKRVSRFSVEKLLKGSNRKSATNREILDNNIAYLNLEHTTKREIKNMFKEINSTAGLIIDLRNYPRNISESDISDFIYPKKDIFIKVLMPYLPSIGEHNGQSGLKILKNPFKAGRRNKNFYDKKIVLLVDRNTGSKAEFIGMAIQNAPNSITIGEQTIGAVMNIFEFPLIDGTTINFTGMGAFYPDDSEVQRKGLKLNIKVEENALNYDPETYIRKAQEIIFKDKAANNDNRN